MSLSSPIQVGDNIAVRWCKLQRFIRLIADNAGISYTMSGFLTDINLGDNIAVRWAKLGAWMQLVAAGGGGLPTTANLQKGSVALVAGQQSYNIVFSPAFASVPTYFDSPIRMVNSSGEIFTAEMDITTLTAAGVTVWLNGVPTAASDGSFINWVAIL